MISAPPVRLYFAALFASLLTPLLVLTLWWMGRRPTPFYVREKNPWIDSIVPQIFTDSVGDSTLHFNNTQVLDRREYRHTLIRYLNLDPSQTNFTTPRVLLIGSDSVLGRAIIRHFETEGIQYIALNGPVHFNISTEDAWVALDTLHIQRVIFIHRPIMFKSYNESYIQYLNQKYLENAHGLITRRQIPVVYIAPPPHFDFYQNLSNSSRVILVPDFADMQTHHDPRNAIARVRRECDRKREVIFELFDESQENLSLVTKDVIDFVLRYETGLFAVESRHSKLTRLHRNECAVWITTLPRHFNTISFSTLNPNSILRLDSPDKIRIVDSANTDKEPYVSIVVVGTGTDVFIARAERFLAHISKSINNVPLADIEVVIVDYGTPIGEDNIHLVMDVPQNLNGKVRCVVVPLEFHMTRVERYRTESFLFVEAVAKNIGIRRARGQFIAALNVDTFLPQEFFELCAQRQFNDGVLYLSERTTSNFSFDFSKFALLTNEVPELGESCGVSTVEDFAMMSHNLWESVNGYNEYASNIQLCRILKSKMLKFVGGGYISYLPVPVIGNATTGSYSESDFQYANSAIGNYTRYGRLRETPGDPDTIQWGANGIEFDIHNC